MPVLLLTMHQHCRRVSCILHGACTISSKLAACHLPRNLLQKLLQRLHVMILMLNIPGSTKGSSRQPALGVMQLHTAEAQRMMLGRQWTRTTGKTRHSLLVAQGTGFSRAWRRQGTGSVRLWSKAKPRLKGFVPRQPNWSGTEAYPGPHRRTGLPRHGPPPKSTPPGHLSL